MLPKALREEWYQEAEEREEHTVTTWWTTKWYQTPSVRHLWGEPQYELHPGAQELFLDLIFVGVAFRLGTVLKASFYSCAPSSAGYASDVGSGYASSSSGSTGGRLLGSAYDAAEPECIGLPLGLLHALAPFMCMYMVWQGETVYRAQYFSWCKVNACLDVLGNLLLMVAGMHMRPAHEYRGRQAEGGGTKLASVLVPILCAHCLWMSRYLVLMLFARRECARRQSLAEFETLAQVALLFIIALVIAQTDFGSLDANMLASDGAAAMMWLGPAYSLWRKAMRPLTKLLVPGKHLDLEHSAVCNNSGFITHRNNEFMFLMLGETVLQIVISDNLTGASEDVEPTLFEVLLSEATATATAGLMLAVAMMFSFRQMVSKKLEEYEKINDNLCEQSQITDKIRKNKALQRSFSTKLKRPTSPTEGGSRLQKLVRKTMQDRDDRAVESSLHEKTLAAQRLLLNVRVVNVVSNVLFTVNAMAVMLVGVGVKLALNDPVAASDAHFALEQRLQLGGAVAAAFTVQLINSIIRNRHHYASKATLRAHPAHLGVLGARVCMIAAKVGLCFLPMRPVELSLVLAACALLHCALQHIQEYRVRVTSDASPAAAKLPEALQLLRDKAQRARERETRRKNSIL